MFTVGETPVPGFPELNVVSNIGRTRPPRSTFHTDTSYVRKPPAYTALRAAAVPKRGGQTLFSDQYAAYETLPSRVRQELRGRTITHVVTGLDLGRDHGEVGCPSAFSHSPNIRTNIPVSVRSLALRPHQRHVAAEAGARSSPICSTIRPAMRTSTGTPGRPVTSSCGTTVAFCTVPTTSACVGDRVLHRGMVADDTRE